MFLTALAIVPGLSICFYFFYKDAHNPEPPRFLVTSFLLGLIAVLPAGLLELGLFNAHPTSISSALFTAYIAVGLVEESCKFLVLRYYAFSHSSFDEPLDGIVYSIMISMGFATFENAGYTWRFGYEVAFLRMFTSIPAHASFAVIMGYFAGIAKFTETQRDRLLLYGLLSSVVLHGTYDAFILLSENEVVTRYMPENVLFAGALLTLMFSVALSRNMVRLHYRTSVRLFRLPPKLIVKDNSYNEGILIRQLMQSANLNSTQLNSLQEHWKRNGYFLGSNGTGDRLLYVLNRNIPVGFLVYKQEGSVASVLYLYVQTQHRLRGFGQYLLQYAEAVMLENGAFRVQLHVHPENSAKLFFEKQYFHSIGHSVSEEVVKQQGTMEKSLQSPQSAKEVSYLLRNPAT